MSILIKSYLWLTIDSFLRMTRILPRALRTYLKLLEP